VLNSLESLVGSASCLGRGLLLQRRRAYIVLVLALAFPH
jgi:hypothetical protein